MNRFLPNGYRLFQGDGYYEIKSAIGSGASCVVYMTSYTNRQLNSVPRLLKEYNPRRLNLVRDERGMLHLPEEQRKIFDAHLERFCEASKLQLEFSKDVSTRNVTPNITNSFKANGTEYIAMTCNHGEAYDKIIDEDLTILLKRLRAIAQVIAKYHDKGYLHLDIKPQNVFTIPETAEFVILFDFDSLVLESEVKRNALLSYTEGFAAPEQRMPNRRHQICKATDLYAIGEMLFYGLTGRHSTALEHAGFCKFVSSFDLQKPIFKNVKCTTLEVLSDILNHTLCSNPRSRYQSAAELIAAINAILSKPQLMHRLPPKADFFYGRDGKLNEVDRLLEENGYVFITGLGGIGKSELCKQYAYAHKNEYDAVVFAICNSDLRTMILDEDIIKIENFQGRSNSESDDEFFDRKFNAITDACNERILLIIDNLNMLQGPLLGKLLELNCKKLITTRCDMSGKNYVSCFVSPIENSRRIFDHWYPFPLSNEDDSAVKCILEMFQHHTLTVELVAKQLYNSDLLPSEMLRLLVDGGLRNSGNETIEQAKDNSITEHSLYQHICMLFDISNLSADKVTILLNLSLLPPTGIERRKFKEWCKLGTNEDIIQLIRAGWIQEDKQARRISLHPVIADVMQNRLEEDFFQCETMLKSIGDAVEQQSDGVKDDSQSYLQLRDIALYVCSQLCRLNCAMPVGIQYYTIILDEFAKMSDLTRLVPYVANAIKVHEQLCREPNILTAHLYVTFANVLHEGNCDGVAIDYLEKAQNLLQYLDCYDANVISMQLQIGKTLCYMGKGEYSEEILLKNLKRALDIPDFSHYTLAAVYSCLGDLRMSQSKYTEAKMWYQNMLDICRKTNRTPDRPLASAYMSFAVASAYAEEFKEADDNFALAEKMFEELLGRDCAEIADIYEMRAEIYFKSRKYALSEKYCLDSLMVKEKLYGQAHPKTKTNLYTLSEIYRQTNQHTKAVEYLVRALLVALKNDYPDKILPAEWLAGIAHQLLNREVPLNGLAYGHISISTDGTFTFSP